MNHQRSNVDHFFFLIYKSQRKFSEGKIASVVITYKELLKNINLDPIYESTKSIKHRFFFIIYKSQREMSQREGATLIKTNKKILKNINMAHQKYKYELKKSINDHFLLNVQVQ